MADFLNTNPILAAIQQWGSSPAAAVQSMGDQFDTGASTQPAGAPAAPTPPGAGQPQPQLPNLQTPPPASVTQPPNITAPTGDLQQELQRRMARIDQDRQTAKQILLKAMDPNAVFEYLPKPSASGMLQDALYNFAQANARRENYQPIQMQRLGLALQLHGQKQRDLMNAYTALNSSIQEESNAMNQMRFMAEMQNRAGIAQAADQTRLSSAMLRYKAQNDWNQIREYDQLINKDPKSKAATALAQANAAKVQQLNQNFQGSPQIAFQETVGPIKDHQQEWARWMFYTKMSPAMLPKEHTTETQLQPETGATRTVSTTAPVLPGGLGLSLGGLGSGAGVTVPTSPVTSTPVGAKAPTGVGSGWVTVNPKDLMSSEGRIKAQSQVNNYDVALERLNTVMDNLDVLKNLPSALKVAVFRSPGAVPALASRFFKPDSREAKVISAFINLEEDVGKIRSSFNPGFRGEEAWRAMQNQVGSPVTDPGILRNLLQSTQEAMLGSQAPFRQALMRSQSQPAMPTKKTVQSYFRAVGWDGKSPVTKDMQDKVKALLVTHGYGTK